MSSYSRLAGLPVVIDGYELERRELPFSRFTRVTTTVHLRGGGEEGVGEDVIYDGALHDDQPPLPLDGSWTLAGLSAHLEALDLIGRDPGREVYRAYRRWAYESAALDLALRQAGTSLAAALGRELRPVSFVVSMSLPEPPSADVVRRWLEFEPALRFKLDAKPSWDEALVEELAATGAVDSVDLKGTYRGTVIDNPADARLYRLVAERLPDAWIEDPDLSDPEAAAMLERHRDRITWDEPIHSVEDVDALPFPPRTLNVKPSRSGSLERVFGLFDLCAGRGIATYGGGQFELGPGRGQIQYLASLFSPDGPNDVAPRGYNSGGPRPGLPSSPLPPEPSPTGFRWEENDTKS